MQVGQGIFVLADLAGLDVVLENPFGGEVEFTDVKERFAVRRETYYRSESVGMTDIGHKKTFNQFPSDSLNE